MKLLTIRSYLSFTFLLMKYLCEEAACLEDFLFLIIQRV
jgi:hypothetical protein